MCAANFRVSELEKKKETRNFKFHLLIEDEFTTNIIKRVLISSIYLIFIQLIIYAMLVVFIICLILILTRDY